MTPLPSKTSKSLNTYKFHWSQELFFTSISKIPLMSVYWSNDFNNTVRINNSSLQEVIKQILPTTNQFEKILAIINKNLSIWIDQALLEENSLHQDNESQEVLEEVKNQGIDFLVAYYESIISGLKQELKELKEGIKFNNQDILSVLNMLEEPPISDVNIDDDRSPRERLLDLVSKIKSILYEYLEKLKLFNQIESYTYNIPSFTAPNYVISIPIYVLIPKNVEMKMSNCKFIYPSIIPGFRKYLGEQLVDYSKLSQVGKYLRSCCIVESALDPILNEARKNDFFQFRFKTSIDMGSDGLRSKRIF